MQHTVLGASSARSAKDSLQKCMLSSVRKTHQHRCAVKTLLKRPDILGDVDASFFCFQHAVKIEREPGVRTLKSELKVREVVQTFYGGEQVMHPYHPTLVDLDNLQVL